jgi:hypothetical protein
MRVCLFFTGGYDSTYILYKLLTETDHEVTATILVRSENEDIRSDAMPAFASHKNSISNVDLVVEELRKIRDFKYTQHSISSAEFEEEDILSVYKKTEGRSKGPWNYIAYYAVANKDKFDMVASGITWEQMQKKFYNNKGNDSSAEQGIEKINYLKKWIADRAPNVTLFTPLLTHEYHQNFTRWHVFKYLPEQYAQIASSCASPIKKYNSCEKCFKCLWDRMVRNLMLYSDYSSEQIEEYRHSKALEYGGGDGITAPLRVWVPIEMRCYAASWYSADLGIIDTKEKAIEFSKNAKSYY